MSHLFISHSTRDGAQIAHSLTQALEAAGHRCWIAPRDVKPGLTYPGQIVSAIQASIGLIVIISPAANESPDVLQELQIASTERKAISPIIVGETKPSPDIRYYVGVRHQIPWTNSRDICLALLPSFPARAVNDDTVPLAEVSIGRHQEAAAKRAIEKAKGEALNEKPASSVGVLQASPCDEASLEASAPTGRLIAVASGKGGVGKTWLAITLAAGFASSGKRVLLIDASSGLSGVDSQLNIQPRGDIVSVVSGAVRLADAVNRISVATDLKQGFDTAPLRMTPDSIADLSAQDVAHGAFSLSILESQYDVVIVDLDSGIEEHTMRLVRSCRRCVIVATDEPTALTDAYAFLKVLRGYSPKTKMWIAVNMADTPISGRRTYEALAKASKTFLGHDVPLAGIVTRDAKIRDAIRKNAVLMTLEPAHSAIAQVMDIANVVNGAGDP